MNKSEGQVIIAVLMPHAPVLVPVVGGKRGNRASASVSAMAEAARRIVSAKPETVVLISPHTPRRHGAFAIWGGRRVSGSLAQFGAPAAAVDLPADETLAGMIVEEAGSRGLECWRLRDAELDHGAVVPLWHLADAGWNGPTVVIGLNYPGEPGLAELGAAIAAASRRTGQRAAVVASGDMSHCLQPGAPAGFHPRAKEFDSAFIECLRAGDYRKLPDFDSELQDLATEDALDSTLVAASAVNWNAAGHEVLSYEGPFGVGYGVAILHQPPPESASAGDHETVVRESDVVEASQALSLVAWTSIEAALRGNVAKPDMPAEGILGERHGVFVTIRGPGRKLRGCVGTLTPRFVNTIEETWHVARDAAFRDGRFAPVRAHELEQLRCEVSVIMPLEDVASPAELDPRHYGVVVAAADGRRGVLLPGIKEIQTVEQQLDLARLKGGIDESEPVRIQRFAVVKFGGED
jgi:AMMECR1 domain-containing protein/aromatic ring-opening dioxygenase LigB subunit